MPRKTRRLNEMAREQFKKNAGWRDSRWHEDAWASLSVYEAAAQGVDVDGRRFAVVCESHGSIMGAQTMADARALMAFPDWCSACQTTLLRRATPQYWRRIAAKIERLAQS